LTISPELLGELQSTDAPLKRVLDPAAAKSADIHALTYNEATFRFALNEDQMATEKLSEGIRTFAADAGKLDKLIEALK
jgi:transaldolase